MITISALNTGAPPAIVNHKPVPAVHSPPIVVSSPVKPPPFLPDNSHHGQSPASAPANIERQSLMQKQQEPMFYLSEDDSNDSFKASPPKTAPPAPPGAMVCKYMNLFSLQGYQTKCQKLVNCQFVIPSFEEVG